MSLTIFRAEPDDASALAELAAETFPLACPPDAPRENIDAFIAANFTVKKFTSYLSDAQRDIFLAVIDGEPAGYTMLVETEPTDADVRAVVTQLPTAELSKFYVLPGHHGSGISAELMSATIEAARDRGVASVWLGVNNENAKANRFYEKHGFVTVGTKRFQLGERWEDDFVRTLAF
jgi:ribosomal protein S18 acetylase RimI-like enzyme